MVQQILQISSLMEEVSFVHILREWNKAIDCLAKWASTHLDGWRIEGWDQISQDLRHELNKIIAEDGDGIGDG